MFEIFLGLHYSCRLLRVLKICDATPVDKKIERKKTLKGTV